MTGTTTAQGGPPHALVTPATAWPLACSADRPLAPSGPPLSGLRWLRLLTRNADSDFSGQTWALDNYAQHQVITNIVQSGNTYSYDVQYDVHGTFTTQVSNYVGYSNPSVAIPLGAHGVMDGSGQVHVTGATQVPDQKYLKSLDGSTAGESAVLAPGGQITQWNYDYNYKIPGTSFVAEQSNTVNTP